MEFTKVLSERGKELILFENYKFYQEKTIPRGLRWRCTVRGCTSRVTTNTAQDKLLHVNMKHNHGELSRLKRQIISNKAKKRALEEDACDKSPKVVLREMITNQNVDLNDVDVKRITQNIYRERKLKWRKEEKSSLPNDDDDDDSEGELVIVIDDENKSQVVRNSVCLRCY